MKSKVHYSPGVSLTDRNQEREERKQIGRRGIGRYALTILWKRPKNCIKDANIMCFISLKAH